MKTEKEVIKMKTKVQELQRKITEIYSIQDPRLAGFEQALHWILMPSEEK